jgi:hypothetical protein
MSGQHRWTADDEAACVGAWYAHDGKLPDSLVRTLSRLIGTTEASIVMKMGNISSVIRRRGLDQVASATRIAVAEFTAMTPAERGSAYRAATDRLRGTNEPIGDRHLSEESQARLDASMARRRDRMDGR